MARLSSASKKAASTVASKIGNNGSSPTSPTNAVANSSAIANSQTSISIPGLMEFTPSDIQGMLPQFDEGSYQVTDPLNPPEIPQARIAADLAKAQTQEKLSGLLEFQKQLSGQV